MKKLNKLFVLGDVFMKKKLLTSAIFMAVASVGFVVSASAAEHLSTDVDPVVVEGQQDVLPGGLMMSTNRVGILGNVDAVDVPFTQRNYSEKTIQMFEDPNQGINGVLANNPSIRVGSPSPMYTDFNMRGVNMNAAHYYINGIPNMFNQTRSIPAYVLESVDIVSGPNTVLNGSTFSNNGTNGTDAPAGMLNGTTKKATDKDINRYTQKFSGGSVYTENLDLGRRFGKDKEWGVRVNLHKENGNLAVHGNKIDDKTVYVNIDHKTAKSSTNLFGGYFDWHIDGGQRWLSASGLKKGELVNAPSGKNNLGFDEQYKENHGYLMTLNHIQKISNKWQVFANLGYNNYNEHKNDPNTGSLTLKANGELGGNFRDYISESHGVYGQIGTINKASIGDVKNTLSVAVDTFDYKSRAVNSGSTSNAEIKGDIYGGVKVMSVPSYKSLSDLKKAKWATDKAVAMTIADRVEYGKASLYMAGQYRNYKYTSTSGKEISKKCLNPTFALAYKPVEKVSVYASHSQAYTRPYEVGSGYDNTGELFNPIKNKQTEMGVKYNNGGILHSIALFDLNQGAYINEKTNGATGWKYTQEGENRFKGFEYSLTGKVAKKWNLAGGFMYLNGKREKTASAQKVSGVIKDLKSKDGWYATGTPKWNAVLTAEYEADKDTSIFGRMNYTGKAHLNDNGEMVKSFATFDLGVKHKFYMGKTGVTVNATCYNLLGKDYWISRGTSVALGAPRTFMLGAQFDI